MARSAGMTCGCVAASLALLGGCHDLMKSRSGWSRTDNVTLTYEELARVASQSFIAAGIAPSKQWERLNYSVSEFEAKGSPTFMMRKAVWYVTGFPVALAGGAAGAVVFAIPTAGASVVYLLLPLWNTDKQLAENHMNVTYQILVDRNGRSSGTCEVKALGMAEKARWVKERLWAELDLRLTPYIVKHEDGVVGPDDSW